MSGATSLPRRTPRSTGPVSPPLSVVMPVHDGMPFVRQSVESLLAQSFGEFELVIGDDGSDDGTTELLREYAARDLRIRLLRRERPSGLAHSANWVISEAQAPLIAIAHADDVSLPGRLAREIELLRGEPAAVLVAALSDGIDESGRTVRPPNYAALARSSAFAPFAHSSIMFRKEAFDRAGRYRAEAEYWEDFDLYLRLAELGRILVIPEILTQTRHARVSTRLRVGQEQVEEKVGLMYRCFAAYRRGEDYTPLLRSGAGAVGEKLHPRTFVACGWTALWMGRRPATLKRMFRRARLRPDLASLQSLIWVLWGSLSPKSLRLFTRRVIDLRNRGGKRAVEGRGAIPWDPRRGQRAEH